MNQPTRHRNQRAELVFLLYVFAVLCLVFQALNWKVAGDPDFWLFLGLASVFAAWAVEHAPS